MSTQQYVEVVLDSGQEVRRVTPNPSDFRDERVYSPPTTRQVLVIQKSGRISAAKWTGRCWHVGDGVFLRDVTGWQPMATEVPPTT